MYTMPSPSVPNKRAFEGVSEISQKKQRIIEAMCSGVGGYVLPLSSRELEEPGEPGELWVQKQLQAAQERKKKRGAAALTLQRAWKKYYVALKNMRKQKSESLEKPEASEKSEASEKLEHL